jgi:hypothetical protein
VKREVAQNVCDKVEEIFSKMQLFNQYIVENCERPQTDDFVRAVGMCIMEMDFNILEPVYREHPELKPAFLPWLSEGCKRPQ